MISRFAPFIAVVVLSCAIIGCSKKHNQQTESTYTFTNQTGRNVTLDLYANKSDYGNNANRLERLEIAPNGSDQLVLKVGESYWVDWYTNGYTYNNWDLTTNNTTLRPELKVADINDSRTLSAVYADTLRSIMLNGGGTSSTWKGVANTGTGIDGTHEFTFRKDFTAIHTQTSPGGQTIQEQLNYRVISIVRDQFTTQSFMLYMDRQGLSVFRASCNLKNMPTITGRDSLQVSQASGSSFSFFIRRQ